MAVLRLRFRYLATDVAGFASISAVALALLGLVSSIEPARAQDVYPTKPIQLVVTTAAGGALDLVARTVADRLSASMHQPVIIENQPAGNGTVAAGQFAKAAPDGHN
jgi:tripartite-type tricarboxylate transporter receptor subunit TctC